MARRTPKKTQALIAIALSLILAPMISYSRPDTSDFDPRVDSWAAVEDWEVLFCKQWGGHKEELTTPGARASFPIALSQMTLTLQAEVEVTTVTGVPGTGSTAGASTLMGGADSPVIPIGAPSPSGETSPASTGGSTNGASTGSNPASTSGSANGAEPPAGTLPPVTPPSVTPEAAAPTGAAVSLPKKPISQKTAQPVPESYFPSSSFPSSSSPIPITGAAVATAAQPATTNKLYKVSWYIEPIAGSVDFEVFLIGDGELSLTEGVKTATNTRAEFGYHAQYHNQDFTSARIKFGNDFLEVPIVGLGLI
ncbi:hypothetical protein HYU13_04180 [Candidatus Woesearchaeota archaeon]|nr:hypothetical protein [Candidatus Woesearchaeota archaeon]